MRSYHVLPVYPPTEDIHVGDIYAVDEDPPGKNDPPIALTIKLDYWNMRQDLENYYDNVPVLPDTGDKPTDGTIWRQQPATDGGGPAAPEPLSAKPKSGKPRSVFAESGTLTKLPLMALPGFTIARADAESLSGSVPFHLFSAIFGAARSNQDVITINIPVAETYGVPAASATADLVVYCAENQNICSKSYITDQLASTVGKIPNQTAIYLINRLYLTRRIEYVYNTSTAVGAQAKFLAQLHAAAALKATAVSNSPASAKAKPTTDETTALSDAAKALTAAANALAGAQQKAGAPTPAAGTSQVPKGGEKQQSAPPAAGQPATTPDELATIKKRLDDLLTAIQGSTSQLGSAPGGSFSIGAVSDQGITLVQTFERPIAIGYRAVEMEPLGK